MVGRHREHRCNRCQQTETVTVHYLVAGGVKVTLTTCSECDWPRCSQCEAHTPPNGRFCPSCGARCELLGMLRWRQ